MAIDFLPLPWRAIEGEELVEGWRVWISLEAGTPFWATSGLWDHFLYSTKAQAEARAKEMRQLKEEEAVKCKSSP